MKYFDICMVIVVLFALSGCGEKNSTSTSQSLQTKVEKKELTAEENFVVTKGLAESGDAAAKIKLCSMYKEGDGVEKDYNLSLACFQKLADMGNVDAQYQVGVLYLEGMVKDPDQSKAIKWIKKAVEGGSSDAQAQLGRMYIFGEGVRKDSGLGLKLLQEAANQGNARGLAGLGATYYDGEIVKKDTKRASQLWEKSAAKGNRFSMYWLGNLYSRGDSVPKDEIKAVEYWRKAAILGYEPAQHALGGAYLSGLAGTKDLVLAYAWANIAAAGGEAEFSNFRNHIETKLSDSQRQEGQRIASNWRKGFDINASEVLSSIKSPENKSTVLRTGTAFTVSVDGHALTNHHVISGCGEIKVAGHNEVVTVLASDTVNDLALLKVPVKIDEVANLSANITSLRQGEDVIVFGYPLNFVLSSGGNLTPGTVSALTGLGNNTNQIQITAPIQPGSSGSPVMDKKGNIVGVVSMKLDDGKMARATGQVAQNVNFAVNGQTVKAFLDANKVQYKTGGGFLSREKSNADIAEAASKWTVLVECRK